MTIPIFIIVVSWLVLILYWIASAIGVKKDLPQKGIWSGGRGILLRLLASAIVIYVVVSRRGQPFNRFGVIRRLQSATSGAASGPVLATIGAILCVLGVIIALWARWHLGRNWSYRPALKADHELITSGPYRVVRHPIYTGILLACIGSLLVTNWSLLVIALLVFAVFAGRSYTEEQLMLRQFPDQYPAYKKRTWALIPFIY